MNYTADPVEWFLLLEIPDLWRIVVPVGPSVEADDAISDRYLQGCLNNLLPREEPYEIEVRAIYRVKPARRRQLPRRGGCSSPAMPPISTIRSAGWGSTAGCTTRSTLSRPDRRGDARERRARPSSTATRSQRKPEAVNAINAITERNKKLMEERDPEIRARNLDDWRALAADPERCYRYLLETSMISSLRRSGMIA